jgi:anaerobic magnesium-protoporphyrin IX monomethyl ester cyclase
MKIALLAPNITGIYGKPSSPPVGMAYLMSYLRNKGHEVKVLDLCVEKDGFDYIKAIKEFNPSLIGISFTSCKYKKSYALVKDIKSKTGIPIVIGGAHVSVIREDVLGECEADYAIYGEGEHALLNLAEGKKLNEIKSLIWRDSNRIVVNPQEDFISDLDALPLPEYEFFRLEKYANKRIPITTARGCPHMCVYCAVDRVIGRRFRTRSPKNVVDEIEHWYRKGYKDFGFNDDTFTENTLRAEEICDELVRRNIDIKWDLRTGIRVDRVNASLLGKLKKAGCKFVAFGIESVDEKVLKAMKKGTTSEQARTAVRMAKDAGLGVGGFFMIGNPGDSYEAFKKSYNFAKNELFDEIRFYNVEPYPGTELEQLIDREGHFFVPLETSLNSYSRWNKEPVFEFAEFPKKERIRAFNEGETLVVSRLVSKVMGRKAGELLMPIFRIGIVRRLMLKIGFRFSAIIFKVMKTGKER